MLHGNAPCQETFIKLKYMRSFKFFTDLVGFLRRSWYFKILNYLLAISLFPSKFIFKSPVIIIWQFRSVDNSILGVYIFQISSSFSASRTYRSCRPEVLYKKRVIKNFPKLFTGKRLCPVTLLKKRLRHRCFRLFTGEFCEIFKNTFF